MLEHLLSILETYFIYSVDLLLVFVWLRYSPNCEPFLFPVSHSRGTNVENRTFDRCLSCRVPPFLRFYLNVLKNRLLCLPFINLISIVDFTLLQLGSLFSMILPSDVWTQIWRVSRPIRKFVGLYSVWVSSGWFIFS